MRLEFQDHLSESFDLKFQLERYVASHSNLDFVSQLLLLAWFDMSFELSKICAHTLEKEAKGNI